MYIMLDSMYETMSISTGLYPKLDLWNTNKLQLQSLLLMRYMALNYHLLLLCHLVEMY